MSVNEEKLINYQVKDCIATITLNRPRKGNALNPPMVSQFISALEDVNERKDVRIVVLTGNGRYFCTGMDLSASNQKKLRKADKKNSNFSANFIVLCNLIKDCPFPVICRMNGPALGGGNVLVFLADIRIARHSCYFQFSEVNWGIIPAMISTFIVPQLGPFLSKELFLTGRRLPASRAFDLGFVTAVTDTPPGGPTLDQVTRRYISYLRTSASDAMRDIKELVAFEGENNHDDNVIKAVGMFQKCLHGTEFRYGIKMRSQKKKPDWDAHFLGQAKL